MKMFYVYKNEDNRNLAKYYVFSSNKISAQLMAEKSVVIPHL